MLLVCAFPLCLRAFINVHVCSVAVGLESKNKEKELNFLLGVEEDVEVRVERWQHSP